MIVYTNRYIYVNTISDIVRLKKHLNRKDKDTGKEFFRFNITIDPKLVKELGWKAGDELESETKGKELRIKKK